MNAVPPAYRLSVAPMIDLTDRHCRYLHRQMSRHTLLYTEMVVAAALVRGGALRLLDHDPSEQPVAVQLGGSEPGELAAATRICVDHGYREVNLNVGCPSDRVQSGCFGAVLMRDPALVSDCLAAMREAAEVTGAGVRGAGVTGVEVTVKCRIGVDDQVPEEVLPAFLETVQAAGIHRVIVHARKAWLKGLSPKENREIPPLDYPLVLSMKRAFPDLTIIINGGIGSLATARELLEQGLDGVMIGRAAYHDPGEILLPADRLIFGSDTPDRSPEAVVAAMRPYIARHLAIGGRLGAITRHMLGLFAGRPGARSWRRSLSEAGSRPDAGLEALDRALEEILAAT
ncbi:tRNA-dihydrouridine synthase A [Haematobacter massiliensis]|uniref:tRNA-dihydrouridine(20/20a) synthase n=1 Tax=Haematobacter massiliensis TaxID=195105 RepID=A0A086YAK6_9RHOB|nr:tRNA dihydrouridine(20/20a) synthase DusA [Haematobacter massiliensis]KFI31306.1 tRNA-dihydrouridine synthase A [Haematobacter massiliensis]